MHIKVALRPAVQGVGSKEDALELIEFIGACSSLQLRGLAADYGLPEVNSSPVPMLCRKGSRDLTVLLKAWQGRLLMRGKCAYQSVMSSLPLLMRSALIHGNV